LEPDSEIFEALLKPYVDAIPQPEERADSTTYSDFPTAQPFNIPQQTILSLGNKFKQLTYRSKRRALIIDWIVWI
jgi:hypothetical protein